MEPLGEAAIRFRTDGKVFERGYDYWKRGAILSVVKSGNTLRAKVEGSDFKPYRVVINWQEDGSVEAQCNCPYAEDWDEWCKHIVAVLLQYDNEIVPEQASLSELLALLSKRELLDLLVTVGAQKSEFYDAIVAVVNGEDPGEEEDETDY